jgi:hypothetical protein
MHASCAFTKGKNIVWTTTILLSYKAFITIFVKKKKAF